MRSGAIFRASSDASMWRSCAAMLACPDWSGDDQEIKTTTLREVRHGKDSTKLRCDGCRAPCVNDIARECGRLSDPAGDNGAWLCARRTERRGGAAGSAQA